jgi:Ca2+-binding EF-hand superfamily protein
VPPADRSTDVVVKAGVTDPQEHPRPYSWRGNGWADPDAPWMRTWRKSLELVGITEHDSFSESELLELLSQGHPVRDLVHDLYVKLRAHSPFGFRTFRNLFLAVDILRRGTCDRAAVYGTLNYCGLFVDEAKKAALDEMHARIATSSQWDSWTCLYQLLVGYSALYGRCLHATRLKRVKQIYEKLVREHGELGELYLEQIKRVFEPADILHHIFPDEDPREFADAFWCQWVSRGVPWTDSRITFDDFTIFYFDMAHMTDEDWVFEEFLIKCWGFSLAECESEAVFSEEYGFKVDDTVISMEDLGELLRTEAGDPRLDAPGIVASLDLDGNGELTMEELVRSQILPTIRLLRKEGLLGDGAEAEEMTFERFSEILLGVDESLSGEELHAMWLYTDCDGGGSVSVDEFLQAAILRVKEYFAKYDKLGARRLSQETFKNMMNATFPRSVAVSEKLFKILDTDRSGEVDLAEFMRSGLLPVLEAFTVSDQDNRGFLRMSNFNFFLLLLLRKRGLDVSLDRYEVIEFYRLCDRGCEEVYLIDLLRWDLCKMLPAYVFIRSAKSFDKFLEAISTSDILKDKIPSGEHLRDVWDDKKNRVQPYVFGRRWPYWFGQKSKFRGDGLYKMVQRGHLRPRYTMKKTYVRDQTQSPFSGMSPGRSSTTSGSPGRRLAHAGRPRGDSIFPGATPGFGDAEAWSPQPALFLPDRWSNRKRFMT